MPSFTSFDGTRIVYRDEGRGYPVLLLHGYLLPVDSMFGEWTAMQAAFSGRMAEITEQAGFSSQVPRRSPETEAGIMARLIDAGARVIAPDMRGHGASDKPAAPGAYGDWAMARDAGALLDHVGVESVDVFGYSMGSINALRLFALDERRIRSAILGGMGPSLSIEGAVWHAGEWEKYMADDGGEKSSTSPKFRTWEEWTCYAADVLVGRQLPFGVASGYATCADLIGFDRAIAAAVLRSLGNRIAPEALKDVGVPVLVLNGNDDVMKAEEQGFAALFPNIRFGKANGDHITALFDAEFQREIIRFFQWRWSMHA